MSFLFQDIRFIWSLFDSEEEEESEDFKIEEIRFCNCFIDQIVDFIEKNNGEINFDKLYKNFFWEIPKRHKVLDVFVYYTPITIFCCSYALDICSKEEEVNRDEMDKNCLAQEIDYLCLYYLSRETIFDCICDNCQKTLLKLVSKKLTRIKLKRSK